MSKARILIVENNADWRAEHANLVSGLGYEPIVVGSGDASAIQSDIVAEAKTRCVSERCHVAIIDMRLYDDEDDQDTSGLALAKALVDCWCIVVSAFATVDQVDELRDRGISVVSKREVGRRLGARVSEFARLSSAQASGLHVEWNVGAPLPSQGSVGIWSRADIEDVVTQLLPKASHVRISQPNWDDEDSSTFYAARSTTLRVDDLSGSGPPRRSFIKVARREKLEVERRNYGNYVDKRVFNHRQHADLLNTTLFYDVGGAEYREVVDARSFRSYYRSARESNDIEHLERIIKSYDDGWSHYRSRPEPSELNLGQLLIRTWDQAKRDRPESQFFQRLERAEISELHRPYACPVEEIRSNYPLRNPLVDPVAWLLEQREANHLRLLRHTSGTLVTHGDLWGENLYADNNANAILIDFEHTGPGWLLQDFVRLEFDVWTRLFRSDHSQASWSEILRLYIQAVEHPALSSESMRSFGEPEAQKAIRVVNAIRGCARGHKVDDRLDAEQYLLALLYNCVFRLVLDQPTFEETGQGQAMKRNWALQVDRARMLGALVAHRLSHPTDRWPMKYGRDSISLRESLSSRSQFGWRREYVEVACFDLGVNIDSLGGGDTIPSSLMRSLLDGTSQGRFPFGVKDLIAALQKQFPNRYWTE